MSKSGYFKIEKLKKQFNVAMKVNNLELAKRINEEINKILNY